MNKTRYCCEKRARHNHELRKVLEERSPSQHPRLVNPRKRVALMACDHCDEPVWIEDDSLYVASIVCEECSNHCHVCGTNLTGTEDLDQHGLPRCDDCWGID